MAFKVWSTQEKALSADINSNFSLAADLASAQTFTGAKTFTAAITVGVDGTGHDVTMYGDSAGAFSLWEESADKQLIQGATAAGPGSLLLSTGELTNVDGGILGRIDFQAPLDNAGTDARLVGASIWAEADATFSSTVNTTDLVFAAATSETAGAVMRMKKASLSPETTDGMSLGTTALNWSDLFLDSGAVVNFDSGDVTLTHTSNTVTVAGGTWATAALTASTITGSGILKTDDTTDATSTTDGSLQTDGGLSVAKDAIIGNDLKLLSDSAVLALGDGSDATLTHDGTTGVTIAANPITITSATAATWSTSAGALTVNGAGGVNVQEGGATIIGISDSRVLSTSNTASIDMDATGAIAVNSSGGVISVANDNVDQNVNLATAGTRTLNIGILDGTDTTTITSKGNQTHSGTITVGADDTGYDVKFFGATASSNLLWDESADDLIFNNAGIAVGSDATGDVYYRDSSGFLERVGIGSDGQVLTSTGSVPNWEAASSGTALTGSTNNTVATVTGANAIAGEANLTFDGTTLGVVGNAGVGIARTEGTLHVHTATAGTIAAHADADDLVVENSAAGGITILTPANALGNIYFGDGGGANDTGRIVYDHNDDDMHFYTGGGRRLEIDSASGYVTIDPDLAVNPILFIHETANANMTVGLTINQGVADDEIFALKSSTDVGHGLTQITETDTWLSVKKNNATLGGATFNVVIEGAGGSGTGLRFNTYGAQSYNTKTSGGVGPVHFFSADHDDSNGITNVSADGNVYSWAARVGGADRTLFIIDEDGDFFYDGSDAGAFDLFDDASLLRAVSNEIFDPATLVRSKWDEMVKYDRQHLEEANLIGIVSDEERARGIAPLVNGAQLQRALVGEAWQGYVRDMEMQEKIDYQQEQIESMKAELKLLKG